MKIFKITFYIFIALVMSSCTVYDGAFRHGMYGTYDPSLSNNYSGLIAYEPGADITSFMQSKCAAYGGLDFSSVRDGTAPKMLGNNLGFVKQYRCYGPQTKSNSPATFQQQNYSQPSITLDAAKKKCAELGLKPGTEPFGNCVLKLSK